jgi:hypothetical protein
MFLLVLCVLIFKCDIFFQALWSWFGAEREIYISTCRFFLEITFFVKNFNAILQNNIGIQMIK